MAQLSFNVAHSPRLAKEVTFDAANVTANTGSAQTVTVTGITTDMFVWVMRPSGLAAGLALSCYPSAKDTLTLVFTNATEGDINPASLVYKVLAF